MLQKKMISTTRVLTVFFFRLFAGNCLFVNKQHYINVL